MGIAQREYMQEPSGGSVISRFGVTPILIAINIAVFIAWQAKGPRDIFMCSHFLMSIDHLKAGHYWCVITSAFSHNATFHLLLNMVVLYSFGSAMEKVLGPRRYLIFFLLAAVASAGFQVALTATGLWAKSYGLGASGALCAVLVIYAILYPKATILLFMVLPVPAGVGAAIFVGFDVWGLIEQYRDPNVTVMGWRIGHGTHLGGSLFGLAYYFAIIRGRTSRSRRKRRRRHRPREREVDYNDPDESRLDYLLGKVKSGGLDALTPEERDFMIRMSERKRRQ